MNKKYRQLIFDKFGGKCAYTGKDLLPDWQVDHIIPKCRAIYSFVDNKIIKDKQVNHIDNLVPTLRIINHYKRSHTLESFRLYISNLHKRMKRYPKVSKVKRTIKKKEYVFQVAELFGVTIEKPFGGRFYFETINNNQCPTI